MLSSFQKISKVLILTVLFWMILLGSSSNIIGFDFGYLDELIIIFLLPLFLLKKNETRDSKLWFIIFVFILYCTIIGYFGGYYRGINLVALDIFLFLKPILFILLFIRISYDTRQRFLNAIAHTGSIYVYIAFIFYPLSLLFNILPTYEYRLGIQAYKFIANTPGEFLNNLIILGSFVILGEKRKKRIVIVLILISFLMLMTLRGKAIVMFFLALLIFYYFKRRRSKGGFDTVRQDVMKFVRKPQFLMIISLGLIPGWHQFKYYFLSDDLSARLLLHMTAYDLTSKFFPIGAGPGTFGSAVARKWYSPIYTSHGFREIYGLDGNDPSFLSDSFWPMVFGQYGIIGFILIIILYKGIINLCSRNLVEKPYAIEIFLITLLSLALSTLGSAILIGAIGTLYMMLLGSMVGTSK